MATSCTCEERRIPDCCQSCGHYKPQFYRVLIKECAAFGTVDGVKDVESLKGIYQLETELKKAMANHGELLADCMDLQVRADEMIHKYKYSRLR